MKKYIYPVVLLVLIFNFSQAQIIRCATYELHKEKMETNPAYKAYQENIGKQIKEWVDQRSTERTASDIATITIPVVVHVVYNNSQGNISDAQIQSQIDVINEDFGGNNTDQNQIPPAFQPYFGNVHLYFALATRMPDGSWTTGVERRQTSITSFNVLDESVKDYSQGGLNGWDKTKYLNIWVCHLRSALGWTELPGDNSPSGIADDGVVVRDSAFGRIGPLFNSYNKGRTTTHEIGHWLGLYHTWGDDGGACTGSDYIDDTPNQADATFGGPSYPLTDHCSPSAPGIMFMNYLDYTDDAYMHMFTVDQAIEMRGVLNNFRASILTSNGTAAPTGFAELNGDAYINIFPNPANEALHVNLRFPSAIVSSVTVFDMVGKEIQTINIHKTGEQTINLNVSSLSTGLYTLIVNTDQGAVAKRFSVTR